MPSDMSSSWHLPCYGNRLNCHLSNLKGERNMAVMKKMKMDVFDFNEQGSEAIIFNVLCILGMMLNTIVLVAVALHLNRRRRLTLLHLISISVVVSEMMGCLTFVLLNNQTTIMLTFFTLMSINARCWLLPCALLLLHSEASVRQSVAMISWMWVASGLLALPPLFQGNTFALASENPAMTLYVAIISFGMPTLILAPLFARGSSKLLDVNNNNNNNDDDMDNNTNNDHVAQVVRLLITLLSFTLVSGLPLGLLLVLTVAQIQVGLVMARVALAMLRTQAILVPMAIFVAVDQLRRAIGFNQS